MEDKAKSLPVRSFSESVKNDTELLPSRRTLKMIVHFVASKHDQASVSEGFVDVGIKHEVVHQVVSLSPVLLAKSVIRFHVSRTPTAFDFFQLGEPEVRYQNLSHPQKNT